MTEEHFNEALKIVTVSNSCKVTFNVPIKDNYSNTHRLLIHECNADCINKLIKSGFSLFMTDKGLSVDRW